MIDVITLTGGLPRDAELRYTPQGAAVANFTLANSDNRYDESQNQWVKTRSMYLDVTIWNEQGNKQNPTPWAQMAADLKKGDQVAVTGKLVTRSWETKDGEKRSNRGILPSSRGKPRLVGRGLSRRRKQGSKTRHHHFDGLRQDSSRRPSPVQGQESSSFPGRV